MNVPVTPEGKLTFEDGISEPGKYVEMRAETDVLAAISNCPQLNNPCNAYNPTPVQVLIWTPAGELMFRKVLIANRGAIACRIIRTLRRMGVASVAVYSAADRHSLHVRAADEAVGIGPAAGGAELSLGRRAARCRRAHRRGGDPSGLRIPQRERRISPKPAQQRGIVFIGPTPAQMRDFGLKHTARAIAAQGGVPLLPGTALLASRGRGRRSRRAPSAIR